MIGLREFRFWTALLIIGLAAYTVLRALPVLRFGLAEAAADDTTIAVTLAPFVNVSTIAVQARRDILVATDEDDAIAHTEALVALLARAPLAGGAWLDLARTRISAGEPSEKVASALALSSLTAPKELVSMADRASFGLPLWVALPPDVRRSLVGDLVGGWPAVSEDFRATLQAVYSLAPLNTREDLRAQLLLYGKPGTAIVDRLRLAPQPALQTVPNLNSGR